jgi:hypothetical protein
VFSDAIYFHHTLIFAGRADAYSIIVDILLKARVFATAIHFLPCLIFSGKAIAYALYVDVSF